MFASLSGIFSVCVSAEKYTVNANLPVTRIVWDKQIRCHEAWRFDDAQLLLPFIFSIHVIYVIIFVRCYMFVII